MKFSASLIRFWPALLGLLLVSCENEQGEENQNSQFTPYNILWVVCEDQSPQFFSFYGDSTIQLPNLERLAAEGIIFDNAYATVPVCAPARSSIITGMYPTTLGSHNMRVFSGYNPKNQPQINVPSYSPTPPKEIEPFTHYLRRAGYYCTNNSKEDYNFKPISTMWDESSNKASWRNREAGQAFFSIFNFTVCHESGIWRQGEKALYVDPNTVPVPPYLPEDSIIRHDLAVNYSNLLRMDSLVGGVLRNLEEDNLLDSTIIIFYADHGGPFPRHKRSVYETGTKVPMLVRYPDGYGKGTRRDDLISFIDLAPTVLTLAGLEVPEHMQGEAFLGAPDTRTQRKYLYTTSDRFDGQYDRKRTIRNARYKYIRNFKTEIPYALDVQYRLQMPMMRRLIELKEAGALEGAPQLWMADQKPAEELYDLAKDPFELNNLIDDPTLQGLKEQLSKDLDRWIEDTKDMGGIEEQELIADWYPNGNFRQLAAPDFQINGQALSLSAEDKEAILAWKTSAKQGWQLYQEPIDLTQVKDTLLLRSERIGYLAGETQFIPNTQN